MSWQVNYAIEYINDDLKESGSAVHVNGDCSEISS